MPAGSCFLVCLMDRRHAQELLALQTGARDRAVGRRRLCVYPLQLLKLAMPCQAWGQRRTWQILRQTILHSPPARRRLAAGVKPERRSLCYPRALSTPFLPCLILACPNPQGQTPTPPTRAAMRAKTALAALLGACLVAASACSARELLGEGLESTAAGAGGRILAQAPPGESSGWIAAPGGQAWKAGTKIACKICMRRACSPSLGPATSPAPRILPLPDAPLLHRPGGQRLAGTGTGRHLWPVGHLGFVSLATVCMAAARRPLRASHSGALPACCSSPAPAPLPSLITPSRFVLLLLWIVPISLVFCCVICR